MMSLKEVANEIVDIWSKEGQEGLKLGVREETEVKGNTKYESTIFDYVSIIYKGITLASIYTAESEELEFEVYIANPMELINEVENAKDLGYLNYLLLSLVTVCYESGINLKVYLD